MKNIGVGRRSSADADGCQVSGVPLRFHQPLRDSLNPPHKSGAEVRIDFENSIRRSGNSLGKTEKAPPVSKER